MGKKYQYILVHRSLRDYPGALACQVAHAASAMPAPDAWAAALIVETAEKMRQLQRQFVAEGVGSYLVLEPDPPYNGSPTVLVTAPVERERVAHLLSGLDLL